MKIVNIMVLLFLASISVAKSQTFSLDFETGTYNITNFDGGALTVIDNPQSSGINTSTKVAQIDRKSTRLNSSH